MSSPIRVIFIGGSFIESSKGFFNGICRIDINHFVPNSGETLPCLGSKVVDLCNIARSEEHTSELQSRFDLVCRLLLEMLRQPPCATLFPTRRSSDLTNL